MAFPFAQQCMLNMLGRTVSLRINDFTIEGALNVTDYGKFFIACEPGLEYFFWPYDVIDLDEDYIRVTTATLVYFRDEARSNV